MESTNGKVCNKCNELKSFEEFYKSTKNKDGYRCECKECKRTSSRKRYIENRENELERTKQYHKENRDYYNEYMKRYRRENPEYVKKLKEQNKKYVEENFDSIKEYKKRYQKEHPDINKKAKKKYRKTDKGKQAVYKSVMKRRSFKHKVDFKPHERKEILDRDKWTCQCCGVKVHDEKKNNETKAHIDHIIPISKGGNSEPSNLQVLCRTCNLSKRDKVLI